MAASSSGVTSSRWLPTVDQIRTRGSGARSIPLPGRMWVGDMERRTTRAVASAPSPLPIPGEGTAKVGRRPVERLGEAHQGVRRSEGRGFERSRPGVGDCRDGLPREPTGLHSRTLTHHVAVRTRSSWGCPTSFREVLGCCTPPQPQREVRFRTRSVREGAANGGSRRSVTVCRSGHLAGVMRVLAGQKIGRSGFAT